MENRQRGRYSQQAAIDELKRRNLWGYVEPILTMGSAVIAEPVSGMAGLAALPYGSEAATRAINRTQEAMTYRPRTQEGENALKIIGELVQPVGDAFIGASEYLGDAAYEATGSPTAGALGYSVPTMALELLGLKGASKLSRGRAYEMGDIGSQASRIGGKQRGIFAGVKAKGADLKAMEAAKELQRRGLSRDEIWQKTGWFEDVDGAWKWEIDDSQAGFIGKARLNELAEKDPYGVVDLSSKDAIPHAELLKNYPDERQLVSYDKNSTDYFGASHNPQTQEIVLGAGLDDAQMKSSALHELQHAIQEREGFARGGSAGAKLWMSEELRPTLIAETNRIIKEAQTPLSFDDYWKSAWGGEGTKAEVLADYNGYVKSLENIPDSLSRSFQEQAARNVYKRLAGEAEARNVQTRLDFTPEQRRATPPWQTLDVPEDELIVRRDGGITSQDAIKELERSGVSDMLEVISRGIREKLYAGRSSFFDGNKFDVDSFSEAMSSLEDRLTDAEWDYAFNSKDWSALARAHLSESDRAKLLSSFSGKKVFHGSPDATIDTVGFKSKGGSKFVSTDIDSARNYAGSDGRVYEEFLNVKNPFFINSGELTLDIDSAPHILDQIRAEGYDSIIPVEGGDIVILK